MPGITSKDTTLDRIVNRLKIEVNGCWNYYDLRGNKVSKPTTVWKRKGMRVSRLVYILAVNPSMDRSLVVRHLCANDCCCNPAHLMEGTQADNMQDFFSPPQYPTIFQPHWLLQINLI